MFPQNPVTIEKKNGESLDIVVSCPICKKYPVRFRKKMIKKKPSPKFRRKRKSVGMTDYEVIERVKIKVNPWKSLSLFTSPPSINENPTLGLPPIERDEIGKGTRLSIDMLREQIRYFTLPAEILPLVLEKYPDLRNQLSNNATVEGIINGFNAIDQIIQSARNGQWDRNLLEWMTITDTALKESSFRASRRYYAVTENNQKAYLSPRHIKERIPEVIRFILYYTTSVPYYNWFVNKILDICESDLELNSELKKIELEQMRKLVPELLHIWHNGLLEYQGDTKGTFNKYKSRDDCQEPNPLKYYAYIEFRYKDGELYKKQKSEWKQKKRKAKPDGWRTCHIIKVTDLDPDFLMKIQNKETRK
jgi:hypothetical protein